MQLMTRKSEEGNQSGLGWIDAETVKFSFNDSLGLKIPHMGWNSVKSIPGSALFNGIEADNRFYFVHSYHVVCDHPGNILGRTEYGFSFTSAVIKDNIYGVQFHPEKSHKYGMRLLQNYCFS
jgi:glutamine amidotransferase